MPSDTEILDWLIDQMESCSGWVTADGLMEETIDLMAAEALYDGESDPDMDVFKQYMRKFIASEMTGKNPR